MVVEQLAHRGIASRAVLDAMRAIPREWFMPPQIAFRAYDDAALPIECRQTISQPYMVARMTELLEPRPAQRVLEIGTGSGYQTAVLSMLYQRVYTIEWHASLMVQASERIEKLGRRNVNFRCSDGSLGWPEQAPFDAILVTAGAPRVPRALLDQLAVGAALVAPVGPADEQTLVRARRDEQGIRMEDILQCRFVKLQGAEGWGIA